MEELCPRKAVRWLGTAGLIVVLIGGLLGSAAGADPAPTDPEKRFPGEGESPTWAVDTERYQGDAEAPKRPAPRPLLSSRVKIVLGAGLLVLHLLLGIVVFLDLRRSSPKMSGLWIWIVVLGGVLAVVAYALFRRNRLLQEREGGVSVEDAPEDG